MVGKEKVTKKKKTQDQPETSVPYSKNLPKNLNNLKNNDNNNGKQIKKMNENGTTQGHVAPLLIRLRSTKEKSSENSDLIHQIIKIITNTPNDQIITFIHKLFEEISRIKKREKRVLFATLISETFDELPAVDLKPILESAQSIANRDNSSRINMIMALSGIICCKRIYEYPTDQFSNLISVLTQFLKQSQSTLGSQVLGISPLNILFGAMCRANPEQRKQSVSLVSPFLGEDIVSLELELGLLACLYDFDQSALKKKTQKRLSAFIPQGKPGVFFQIGNLGSENFNSVLFETISNYFIHESPSRALKLLKQSVLLSAQYPNLLKNLIYFFFTQSFFYSTDLSKSAPSWLSEFIMKKKELPGDILKKTQKKFFEIIQHKKAPLELVKELSDVHHKAKKLNLSLRFSESKTRTKLSTAFNQAASLSPKQMPEETVKLAKILNRFFQLISLYVLVTPHNDLLQGLIDDLKRSTQEICSSEVKDKTLALGVLVDACISLLTIDSTFLPSIKKIFRSISAQLTPDLVLGLCSGIFGEEEEEDEMDEIEEEHLGENGASGPTDSEDDDDDDSSDDDDDSSDDDTDSEDSNDQMLDEEEEDEENEPFPIPIQMNDDFSEEEWSDETMLARDHLLAEAVKSRLQSQPAENNEEIEFISRLLILVKVILKADASSTLSLFLFENLLKAEEIHAQNLKIKKEIRKLMKNHLDIFKKCTDSKETEQGMMNILEHIWTTNPEQNILDQKPHGQLIFRICTFTAEHENKVLQEKITNLFSTSLVQVMNNQSKAFTFVIPHALFPKKKKKATELLVPKNTVEALLREHPWVGWSCFSTLLECIEKKDYSPARLRPAAWLVFGCFLHHQLPLIQSFAETKTPSKGKKSNSAFNVSSYQQTLKNSIPRCKAAFKDYFESSTSEYDSQTLMAVAVILMKAGILEDEWISQILSDKKEFPSIKRYYKKLKATYQKAFGDTN